MAVRKTNPKPSLPKFKSRAEEAEFWETHSPLDYPEEFDEVRELTFARPFNHILPIRFDAKTLDALAAIARSKGLGSSSLARMWLLERLQQETEVSEGKGGRPGRR